MDKNSNDKSQRNSNEHMIELDEQDEPYSPQNQQSNDSMNQEINQAENQKDDRNNEDQSELIRVNLKDRKQYTQKVINDVIKRHSMHVISSQVASINQKYNTRSQFDNLINNQNSVDKQQWRYDYLDLTNDSIKSLIQCFKEIEQDMLSYETKHDYTFDQNSRFIELGCGNGKTVFNIAMETQCYSCGIEKYDLRYQQASQSLEELIKFNSQSRLVNSKVSFYKRNPIEKWNLDFTPTHIYCNNRFWQIHNVKLLKLLNQQDYAVLVIAIDEVGEDQCITQGQKYKQLNLKYQNTSVIQFNVYINENISKKKKIDLIKQITLTDEVISCIFKICNKNIKSILKANKIIEVQMQQDNDLNIIQSQIQTKLGKQFDFQIDIKPISLSCADQYLKYMRYKESIKQYSKGIQQLENTLNQIPYNETYQQSIQAQSHINGESYQQESNQNNQQQINSQSQYQQSNQINQLQINSQSKQLESNLINDNENAQRINLFDNGIYTPKGFINLGTSCSIGTSFALAEYINYLTYNSRLFKDSVYNQPRWLYYKYLEGFNLKIQHDMAEVLTYLDQNEQFSNSVFRECKGTLNKIIQCTKCGANSNIITQNIFILMLPVFDNDLEQSLNKYIQSIEKDGQHECEKCQNTTATYLEEINLNEIMVVQLIRHEFDKIQTRAKKINDNVRIQNQITIDKSIYELKAFCNHIGTQQDYGHYNMHLNYLNNWYLINNNDDVEYKSSIIEALSQSTLLVFQKQHQIQVEMKLDKSDYQVNDINDCYNGKDFFLNSLIQLEKNKEISLVRYDQFFKAKQYEQSLEIFNCDKGIFSDCIIFNQCENNQDLRIFKRAINNGLFGYEYCVNVNNNSYLIKPDKLILFDYIQNNIRSYQQQIKEYYLNIIKVDQVDDIYIKQVDYTLDFEGFVFSQLKGITKTQLLSKINVMLKIENIQFQIASQYSQLNSCFQFINQVNGQNRYRLKIYNKTLQLMQKHQKHQSISMNLQGLFDYYSNKKLKYDKLIPCYGRIELSCYYYKGQDQQLDKEQQVQIIMNNIKVVCSETKDLIYNLDFKTFWDDYWNNYASSLFIIGPDNQIAIIYGKSQKNKYNGECFNCQKGKEGDYMLALSLPFKQSIVIDHLKGKLEQIQFYNKKCLMLPYKPINLDKIKGDEFYSNYDGIEKQIYKLNFNKNDYIDSTFENKPAIVIKQFEFKEKELKALDWSEPDSEDQDDTYEVLQDRNKEQPLVVKQQYNLFYQQATLIRSQNRNPYICEICFYTERKSRVIEHVLSKSCILHPNFEAKQRMRLLTKDGFNNLDVGIFVNQANIEEEQIAKYQNKQREKFQLKQQSQIQFNIFSTIGKDQMQIETTNQINQNDKRKKDNKGQMIFKDMKF